MGSRRAYAKDWAFDAESSPELGFLGRAPGAPIPRSVPAKQSKSKAKQKRSNAKQKQAKAATANESKLIQARASKWKQKKTNASESKLM